MGEGAQRWGTANSGQPVQAHEQRQFVQPGGRPAPARATASDGHPAAPHGHWPEPRGSSQHQGAGPEPYVHMKAHARLGRVSEAKKRAGGDAGGSVHQPVRPRVHGPRADRAGALQGARGALPYVDVQRGGGIRPATHSLRERVACVNAAHFEYLSRVSTVGPVSVSLMYTPGVDNSVGIILIMRTNEVRRLGVSPTPEKEGRLMATLHV